MFTRLKELRSMKGMNQQNFANALGIGQSTLAMMEVGKRDITERHIKTICAVFGVNETWLRTGDGEPFPQDSRSIVDRMAEEYGLSDREKAVVTTFLELADNDRAAVMRYVDALVDKLAPPYAVSDSAAAAIATMQDYAEMVAEEKGRVADESKSAG